MTKAPSTKLVDAATGGKIHAVAATGQQFAAAPAARVFWSRALDAAVVLAAAAAVMVPVLGLMGRSPASEGALAAVGALLWFAVVFAYGMISGTVGAVGDHAGGFRAVRLDDGSRPGVWRGGWRAVLWSFAPLYAVVTVVGMLSGSTTGDWSERYSTRDLRAGIERGMPPVPDPRIAEREARAARAAARAEARGAEGGQRRGN
ncbi:RDD family protein [Sinomonas halotolerans]|uniref:RDD family protein n=1 Tax=Sinomonas halotolerans TaxID=1644133 RepID=A0ABU9WY38_9MICC